MAVTNYITMDGMLMGEMTNGVMRNYGTDALGSVVETVLNGVEENTYQYKPCGGLLAKTGIGADPFYLWNGGSGYRATGLPNSDFYVRRRHYSSTSAIWTTADPLWPKENPYCYIDSNPLYLADPSGLAAKESYARVKSTKSVLGVKGYVTLPNSCDVLPPGSSYIDFYVSFAGPGGTDIDCGVSFSCDPNGDSSGWFITTKPTVSGGKKKCDACSPGSSILISLEILGKNATCKAGTEDSITIPNIKTTGLAQMAMGAGWNTPVTAKHSLAWWSNPQVKDSSTSLFTPWSAAAYGAVEDNTSDYTVTSKFPLAGYLHEVSSPCDCPDKTSTKWTDS